MSGVDFAIVDPHVHHWDPYTTPRGISVVSRTIGRWPKLAVRVSNQLIPKPSLGFLGVPDHILRPYLPVDRARDAGPWRTEAVVHVEAGWTGRGELAAVDETRWVDRLRYAEAGTRLVGIVAHAELRSPRIGDELDAQLAASAKVRGVRQMAARHPDPGVQAWAEQPGLLNDASFLRGFEQLQARKLRFDAWVYSVQLRDVLALAKRFEDAPIILDHLGTPVGSAGPVAGVGHTTAERERIFGQWRDDLARLSECKNVSAKLSGLAMPVVGFGFHTRPTRPAASELVERFGPYVRHALDVFGVDRCCFASNYPMDKPSATYADLFDAYAQLAAERGKEAPRALLRDNALRFYGAA
jgi:L-fuconolactonase